MLMHLSEAGRKLAKRNVAKLKAMQAAIAEMLKEVEDDGQAIDAKESALLVEETLRLVDSHDSLRAKLSQAVRIKVQTESGNPDAWAYVRDVFPDSVVYTQGDTVYQAPYTLAGESVTIGDALPVELAYVAKETPVTESGDALDAGFVPLVEKAVRADGTITVKLIDPGWGSSGYYSQEVLERDGPKVFTKGTKMYVDHPTPEEDRQRPERSVRDLAAVLESNARFLENGPDGPGLYADARVYKPFQEVINEVAEDIGVSIRAMGRAKFGTAEGKQGSIVEAIVGAKSVDFVTDPGRGGKILTLYEAARQQNQGAAAPAVTQQQEANSMLTEAQQKELLESHKTLQEQNKTLTESLQALTTQVARLGEVSTLQESRAFVSQTLAGVNLPEITKARLVESLSGNPVLKDGQIDREAFKTRIEEAAKAEAQYLASVTGGGAIRGMGESFQESAEVKPEEAEKQLAEAFKAFGLDDSAALIAAKGR